MEQNKIGPPKKASSEIRKSTVNDTSKENSYPFVHTNHSLIRSNQRGISNLAISLAIEYGRCFQRQGLDFFVLGTKSLPKNIENNIKEKIENTVVILTPNNEIITCYKERNAMRHISKKQKYLSVG